MARSRPQILQIIFGRWVCVAFMFTCTAEVLAKSAELPTLSRQIGQLLITGFPNTKEEEQEIIRLHIGGIVLGGPKGVVPGFSQKIKVLQKKCDNSLFVAIDQEGGYVSRLNGRNGFPDFPSAKKIGSMTIAEATKVHRQIARLLKQNRINLNLAPVVDLGLNSKNKVIAGLERSYSDQSQDVIKYARNFILQHRKQGVVTTVKHFPGHGSSDADSHLGFVDVSLTWKQIELLPFEKLIQSGDVDIIMTGHLFHQGLDPVYPASLSRVIVNNLLRKKMNYQGVVMSDDIQMRAISSKYDLKTSLNLVLQSGTDMVLIPNWMAHVPMKDVHQIILDLVLTGAIARTRIEESYRRVMQLKKKIGLGCCLNSTKRTSSDI